MLPISWPFQNLISSPFSPGSGISYLLRDEFTTALAADSVNGTAAEPGPGTRVVVDTGSDLSITGGEAVKVSGVANANITYPFTRVAGAVVKIHFRTEVPDANSQVGFGANVNLIESAMTIDNRGGGAGRKRIFQTNNGPLIFQSTNGDQWDNDVVVILRSTGAYYFYNDDTDWLLLYSDAANATASLVAGFRTVNPGDEGRWSFIRIPTQTFLPTPLAYDTFTRADGALGSTEIIGPDSQAVVARVWTVQSGDWEISSNTLITAAVAGAGIATIASIGNGDYLIEIDITTPGAGTTPAGLIIRFTNTSNYWYIKMTPGTAGTDFELIEVNAGVPTTRASSDEDFAVATLFNVKIAVEGDDEWRIFLDDTVAFTFTTTNAFNENATIIGCRDEGDDNFIFDNILIFARGTDNEYSRLDDF